MKKLILTLFAVALFAAPTASAGIMIADRSGVLMADGILLSD